jgi:hypothetical protein
VQPCCETASRSARRSCGSGSGAAGARRRPHTATAPSASERRRAPPAARRKWRALGPAPHWTCATNELTSCAGNGTAACCRVARAAAATGCRAAAHRLLASLPRGESALGVTPLASSSRVGVLGSGRGDAAGGEAGRATQRLWSCSSPVVVPSASAEPQHARQATPRAAATPTSPASCTRRKRFASPPSPAEAEAEAEGRGEGGGEGRGCAHSKSSAPAPLWSAAAHAHVCAARATCDRSAELHASSCPARISRSEASHSSRSRLAAAERPKRSSSGTAPGASLHTNSAWSPSNEVRGSTAARASRAVMMAGRTEPSRSRSDVRYSRPSMPSGRSRTPMPAGVARSSCSPDSSASSRLHATAGCSVRTSTAYHS